MPVPTLVTDLSTTAASNSPSGSDNVFPDLDNYLRALSAFLASIRDNSGNGWTTPYLPLTYSAGTANGVVYLNGSKVVTTGSGLVFDGSNLGLGVTPSASSAKTLEIGFVGSTVIGRAVNTTDYTQGAYYNGGWKYANSTYAAAVYEQQSGAHYWLTSTGVPSAGGPITFTQAMTLDASGNLGVGTTSPDSKIDAVGSGRVAEFGSEAVLNAYIAIKYNSTFLGYIGNGAGVNSGSGATDFGIGSTGARALTFGTNDTERARITSGGDLYVGQTTAGLQTGRSFSWQGVGDGSFYVSHSTANSSGDPYMRFGYNGTQIGSITQNGTTAVAYNTSSDYRLKDNPQPLTGSGAFIDALQPKTWEWKTDGSKGVGFIAHEVQAVSPGSVVGEKDAVDEDGKPVMQAMEYGSAEFIANIIAELQSLRARVAALEAQL